MQWIFGLQGTTLPPEGDLEAPRKRNLREDGGGSACGGDGGVDGGISSTSRVRVL